MSMLRSPQSQAGILSFYDAQQPGPKLNPKVVLIAVTAFVVAVLVASHFINF
ncbi:MAG: preprotein translocase subunit Sec61beta [Candidatus Marsarchaeota archaeon]|nr:preprotein translocase subunit Sec61beta [Candidatus Marsarchaeota archaeon]